MHSNNPIQSHYAMEGLSSRLDNALMLSGLGSGPIAWPRLALVDQFHARGLEASKDLAIALGAKAGDTVLDIGSGFGGPARFLAGAYGCKVTGVDLTPEYVAIATDLTERTGQSESVTFQQADATDLPFAAETFDHAWTQHVGMNVADKDRFYREAARVLKPGGKFAIYDIVRSSDEPPTYPLPWATDPSFSFVVHPEVIRNALQGAGFKAITQEDKTALVLESFAEIARLMQSPGAMPPLNLVAVLGDYARESTGNLVANIKAGHLKVVQILAVRG